MVGSETDQGQISSDYRSIFVRGDVSVWVLWNPNQQPRSGICKWSMQRTTWINGSRTESSVSLSPQANGLVEHQNQTIKNSLVKVLEDNPEMWPHIIEGILFSHRVSRHSSTKYSPLMLMYNRKPVLPNDVKHNLDKDESKERENREGDGDEE